jgi:gliding motility-associated-like protein
MRISVKKQIDIYIDLRLTEATEWLGVFSWRCVVPLLFLAAFNTSYGQVVSEFEDITGLEPFNLDNAVFHVIDFNNDGLDDVIGHQIHANNSSRLYRNNGDGTYTDVSAVSQFPPSNHRMLGDLNKDGFTDVIVVVHVGQDFLGDFEYVFNANGTFYSPSSCNGVNILTELNVNATALRMRRMADFNSDGVYDLLQYVTGLDSTYLFGIPGVLDCSECGYRFDFSQKSVLWTIGYTGDFGLQVMDLDNDFDFDLITAHGPNQYQSYTYTVHLNDGAGGFSAVSDNLGIVGGRINGMTIPGEFNNDGKVDMVSGAADCCLMGGDPLTVYLSSPTNYTSSTTLMPKVSDGYYGGATVVDLNLDGVLDVFWTGITSTASTALKAYVNNGSGAFTEVSAPFGLGEGLTYGCCPIPGATHGVVLDINNDFKPDAVIHSVTWQAPYLANQDWTKLNTTENHSVKLRLDACLGLSDGTGARVSYKTGGSWHHQHYYPKTQEFNQPFLYLGCGANTTIDSLRVEWVGGAESVYTNILVGQYFVATEEVECISPAMPAFPASGIIANPSAAPVINTEISFSLSDTTDISVVHWYFEEGIPDSSGLFDPVVLFPQVPGEYVVTVVLTNADGCVDTLSTRIEIFDDGQIVFPNVFTPNGDGENDRFEPFAFNDSGWQLTIFNRWGNQIFTTENVADGWSGEGYGEGVYYWVLKPIDGLEVTGAAGYVMLLRK